MNSSIFSSEQPRAVTPAGIALDVEAESERPVVRRPASDRAVLAVPLAMLLACELILRLLGPTLFQDVRHLSTLPAMAREMARGDGPSILFLGNSLTRLGVTLDDARGEFAKAGDSPVRLYKVNPSDTVIADWYYLVKTQFIEPHQVPSAVVVGFAGPQLEDGENVRSTRLALYSNFRDVPEIFHYDIRDFGSRVDYLCSRASRCFAYREKIRTIILGALPGYREAANTVNESTRRARPDVSLSPKYECLGRFLAMCRNAGIVTILAAMPTSTGYDVPPNLRAVIDRNGAILADLRNVSGIGSGSFTDGYHMGPQAAAIYSRALARRLMSEPEIKATMLREMRQMPSEARLGAGRSANIARKGTVP